MSKPRGKTSSKRRGFVLAVVAAGSAGVAVACDGSPPPTNHDTAADVSPAPVVAEPEPPPPVRIFTRRFVVNVRTAPNPEAFRVGYLRAGAVFDAKTAEPVGFDGCRKGWFELSTGGFVCRGKDVRSFTGERLPSVRARQPNLKDVLPYEYGVIRRRTPMFRNIPTAAQLAARNELGVLLPPPAEDGGLSKAPGGEGRASRDSGTPAIPPSTPTLAGPNETELAVVMEPQSSPPDEKTTLERLAAGADDLLMRVVMRGFFVSLDREFERGGRRYWRTQANGFIDYGAVRTREGSAFQGVHLGDEQRLPIGFVVSSRTRRHERTEHGRLRTARERPEYHDWFRIVGVDTVGKREYVVDEAGGLYRTDHIRRIDAVPKVPAEVEEKFAASGPRKWIDVDLSAQFLVAYDDTTPVFATLISSGRGTRSKDPARNHETPTGVFVISSKHLTHTMDGDNAIDGPYSIDDVPYVMYFQLAYAIHSAFWHNRFGRTKSHGCINMAPIDARWLYNWAGPAVPDGWHGGYPTSDNPGTVLRIRGETPR